MFGWSTYNFTNRPILLHSLTQTRVCVCLMIYRGVIDTFCRCNYVSATHTHTCLFWVARSRQHGGTIFCSEMATKNTHHTATTTCTFKYTHTHTHIVHIWLVSTAAAPPFTSAFHWHAKSAHCHLLRINTHTGLRLINWCKRCQCLILQLQSARMRVYVCMCVQRRVSNWITYARQVYFHVWNVQHRVVLCSIRIIWCIYHTTQACALTRRFTSRTHAQHTHTHGTRGVAAEMLSGRCANEPKGQSACCRTAHVVRACKHSTPYTHTHTAHTPAEYAHARMLQFDYNNMLST